MSVLSEPARARAQMRPTLLVLGVVSATAMLYCVPMYGVGKRNEDARQFLRNYRPPNEFEAYAAYSMDYAVESSERNDVIFLGDSTARCDVRTTQFEKETGLKAYNLGNAGLLGIESHYHLFRTYLLHHPQPRVVVLNLLPTDLARPVHEGMPPDYQEIRTRFLWCFGPGTEDLRPSRDGFLYLCRQGIKTAYGSLMGGFDRYSNEPIPFYGGETFQTLKRKLTAERGFTLIPLEYSTASRTTISTLDPFSVSPRFNDDLIPLVQLTAEHGIPLLLRLTPFSGEAAEHSPRLRSWASDLKARYPHVIVGRPEVLLYDPYLFADQSHCNAKGVKRFTSLLAQDVKELLARRGGEKSRNLVTSKSATQPPSGQATTDQGFPDDPHRPSERRDGESSNLNEALLLEILGWLI